MGCSPSRTDCSSGDPPWTTVPARKPAPAWASLHGQQLWPGDSSCIDSPWGHSFLQGTSTCSSVGSSAGCIVNICSAANLHGLQGDNLHPHSLHRGLKGNLCSGSWSTCSPSFFPLVTLVSAGSFQIFLVLSPVCYCRVFFLCFLKFVFTETSPVLLIGSALAGVGSILENWLCATLGQLLVFSHRSHTFSSPVCYQNFVT